MQTFLSYENFYDSAAVLDNKRLGKQRVEVLQLLQALVPGSESSWQKHPACKMWRGHEFYLVQYGIVICDRWISKGFKDTCKDKILKIYEENKHNFFAGHHPSYHNYYPEWLGNPAFHASHRSNLLRKFPEHYSKFEWTEPDNLPYVWPVK
jgi:hypothetical protein